VPTHTFGRHKGYKNTDARGGYHHVLILCSYEGSVCVVRGQVVGGDRREGGAGWIYGEKYLRPR